MYLLQKTYNQPYLLLMMATLFWAGNAIAGKFAIGHVSPFALTFLRWFVVVLIVAVIARRHVQQDWQTLKANFGYLFILGAVGFTLFNNLMYLALTTTSAINVTIIQSSLPFFIFVLNFILFRVFVTKYQLLGFPITLFGVLLITTQGQSEILTSLNFKPGDLIMLIAAIVYGLYSVLLNKKPNLHWLSLIAVLSCSAFVASTPFVVWEIVNQSVVWPDLVGWQIVIYTAIFASLLSQSFWIRSIDLIGSNATGLFINLVPLIGTFLAILLLDEQLQAYHIIGLVMIIGGILLSQRIARSKFV